MKTLFTIVLFFCSVLLSAQIDPYLQQVIDSKKPDRIDVIIVLKNQWNADSARSAMLASKLTAQERIRQTVKQVRKYTANSQKAFMNHVAELKSDYYISNIRPFWSANLVAAKVELASLYELAEHKDVYTIVYDEPGYRHYPVKQTGNATKNEPESLQGLKAINAPALWALGYTGKGRIAFGIDTGIFPDHPSFTNRFLGNYMPLSQAWFGFNNPWPFDYGSSDHGTHTMGTTVGMTAQNGDTIGVAYNAYFIAADPIVSSVSDIRPRSELMASFEWALNPDGNEETVSDVPDAINNSWGLSNSGNPDNCDDPVTYILNTVNAAGIAVIFSAGNDGPGAGTIGEPANISRSTTNVFSVGAIDGNSFNIAGFSSNGPTNCYTGNDTSLLIKPEVVAPGVNVYSSVGEDDYGTMSGTSMAAPHVTGAVVLLKEAFPQVGGDEILLALYETAVELGSDGEDNTFGRGLIDMEAAYYALAANYTPAEPHGNYPDAYGQMNKKYAILNSDSIYVFELNVQTIDSSNFSVADVKLFEDGQEINFTQSIITEEHGYTIEIEVNASDLSTNGSSNRLLKGYFETGIETENMINNNFWISIYQPKVVDFPYFETFEDAGQDFSNTELFSENPDYFVTWMVDTIGGFVNDKKAAKMPFIKYTGYEHARDILHLPFVDIRSATDPKFSFSYTYVKRAFNLFKDTLAVVAKYGEDMSQTDTIFMKYGEELATIDVNWGTPQYIPTSFQQWKDTTISIDYLQEYGMVRFEFVAINDNGNNLYINNIAVHDGENPLSTTEIVNSRNEIKIYPNPARSFIFVENNHQKGVLKIYTANGNMIKQEYFAGNSHLHQINIESLSPGLYFVRFEGTDQVESQKLIKY